MRVSIHEISPLAAVATPGVDIAVPRVGIQGHATDASQYQGMGLVRKRTNLPERREAIRAPFNGKISVHYGRRRIRCHAVNISDRGMLLRHLRGANSPPRVRVYFELPERAGALHFDAVVVRDEIHRGMNCWAIAFSRGSTHAKSQICDYIAKHTEQMRADQAHRPSPRPTISPAHRKRWASRLFEAAAVAEITVGNGNPKNGEGKSGPSRQPEGNRILASIALKRIEKAAEEDNVQRQGETAKSIPDAIIAPGHVASVSRARHAVRPLKHAAARRVVQEDRRASSSSAPWTSYGDLSQPRLDTLYRDALESLEHE